MSVVRVRPVQHPSSPIWLRCARRILFPASMRVCPVATLTPSVAASRVSSCVFCLCASVLLSAPHLCSCALTRASYSFETTWRSSLLAHAVPPISIRVCTAPATFPSMADSSFASCVFYLYASTLPSAPHLSLRIHCRAEPGNPLAGSDRAPPLEHAGGVSLLTFRDLPV